MRVAQRGMERAMLKISRTDRVRNTEIREKTRLKDIGGAIIEIKWRWAGHLMRRNDGRWAKRIVEWRPRDGWRGRGRPKK